MSPRSNLAHPSRLAFVLALLAVGCGGSSTITPDPQDGGGDTSVTDSGSGGGDTGSLPDSTAINDTGSAGDDTGAPDTGAPDTGPGPIADPNADGPFTTGTLDATIASIAGGDTNIPVHAAYPKGGPSAGPYPLVIVAHGMQLPASQYYSYVARLATFGYVAMTVDFPTSLFGNDNTKEATDLVGSIDWAKSNATLGTLVDTSKVGITGHSLGGKLALLAATKDPRVKASIVLDPVDGGGPSGCNPPSCITVASLMPSLQIPTGFLGETTDASGGFQPCAPAASNFLTFYANTNSPSFAVTVKGANHMSFLDDSASCGLTCSFCNKATALNADVNGMARAYVTAFYERWLRGNAAYDTYLTGAQAQARYVTTGLATIVTK